MIDVPKDRILRLDGAMGTMIQKFGLTEADFRGEIFSGCRCALMGNNECMAGSFLGMDGYCVQKRIYGRPEQMVCVCDEDGIRCHYDISLQIE